MFSAFTNSFKIPELRKRLVLTISLLFVARIGANIPLPGINPQLIKDYFDSATDASGGVVGMFNMFTGGALLNGAIFGLGIMPYISASIIMQLLGAVFPAISRLQQEGDVGREKLNSYTRYLTLGICLIQGLLLVFALALNPGAIIPGYSIAANGEIVQMPLFWFALTATLFLTTGTMIMVWLGEQITQSGVGNGVSLLITVGILADLPRAVATLYGMFNVPAGVEGVTRLNLPIGVLLALLLLVVTASLVAITQAQRKIPVQYAKRIVGRKVYGDQSSFLPLKVNYAGVMPVIFASALLMFPAQILNSLGGATGISFFNRAASWIGQGEAAYYIIFGSMIFIFSYFWVSIMFRPIQIADDLKKYGGYIPGVRPGDPTAKFLDFVMTRLTFFGAFSLMVIALFPDLLFNFLNIPFTVAIFFGGTGMLITVGVVLDTMRQIETYLLQRHYDGFLKKSKGKAKTSTRNKQLMDTTDLRESWKLWRPFFYVAGGLFVIGLVSAIFN
ncbi:MAG: preprotein translocase subunit SecY [Opitutales bacterium]|nr:preprotein translocase subunit SecY [Opitutales bacterium]